jgi:hypothetical protein
VDIQIVYSVAAAVPVVVAVLMRVLTLVVADLTVVAAPAVVAVMLVVVPHKAVALAVVVGAHLAEPLTPQLDTLPAVLVVKALN